MIMGESPLSRGTVERSMLADEDLTLTAGSDVSFEQTSVALPTPRANTSGPESTAYTYKGTMGSLPAAVVADALQTPGGQQRDEKSTRSRWMDVDDLGDLTEEQRLQVEALLEERDQVRNINQVLEGLAAEMNGLIVKVDTFKENARTSEGLLNLYTRLASQAEHSTNLILDSKWNGMAADLAELERVERERIEAEEQAAAQRAAQEQAAIEAAQAKELEDLRAKERAKSIRGSGRGTATRGKIPTTSGIGRGTRGASTTATRGTRGVVRGRGRSVS